MAWHRRQPRLPPTVRLGREQETSRQRETEPKSAHTHTKPKGAFSWCKKGMFCVDVKLLSCFEAQGSSLTGTDDGVVRVLLHSALGSSTETHDEHRQEPGRGPCVGLGPETRTCHQQCDGHLPASSLSKSAQRVTPIQTPQTRRLRLFQILIDPALPGNAAGWERVGHEVSSTKQLPSTALLFCSSTAWLSPSVAPRAGSPAPAPGISRMAWASR